MLNRVFGLFLAFTHSFSLDVIVQSLSSQVGGEVNLCISDSVSDDSRPLSP